MLGNKDGQMGDRLNVRVRTSTIKGLSILNLNNIVTRSGLMNEVFRSDWFERIDIRQINFVDLNPYASTDWHCHSTQTDRIIGLSGEVKLQLYDGREDSASHGVSELFSLSIADPVMIIFPPGIWHKLFNERDGISSYLNILEQLYDYQNPDNHRLPADTDEIPLLP
jgi:dTDP-4-dehydrorhamnose 3,5-epimerase